LSVCPFCESHAPEGRITTAWEVADQCFCLLNESHADVAAPAEAPPNMSPKEAELYLSDQGIREAEIELESEDD
jgi:hypothetical protein